MKENANQQIKKAWSDISDQEAETQEGNNRQITRYYMNK